MRQVQGQRLRLRYRKDDVLMWIGHLDLLRLAIKLLRRAEVPFATSGRFSPKPRLSFAPALPVGVRAESELLDIELRESIEWGAEEVARAVAELAEAAQPRDFVAGLWVLEAPAPSIAQLATGARYTLQLAGVSTAAAATARIEQGALPVQDRQGRTVDACRGLLRYEQDGSKLRLDGTAGGAGNFNIMRLSAALEGLGYEPVLRMRLGLLDAEGRML
jgi:radical SAM-linked protein